jgi:aryl-alcohol dehydrogenase-like predicted oxidoreductase
MQSIDFPPTGKQTSRIGLGCGRLVGRSSLRQSARLIEKALELGIRYFDVAPSYGLGTADEVVGAVLGDSREVTIATKVGVPRPPYSENANRLRGLVKPLLDRVRPLKGLVLAGAARSATTPPERPRYDFSAAAIHASLEESLRNLRRDSVDVFLAHEPHPLDLSDQLAAVFEGLRSQGRIAAYGVGVGTIGDRWTRFGSIWQSAWPGSSAASYAQDIHHVWHGAVRLRTKEPGTARPHPAAVVREVLERSPGSILLVSASTTRRLEELVREVDP